MTHSDDGPVSSMGTLFSEQRKAKNIAIPLSDLPATLVRGKTVLVTGSNSGLGLEAAQYYYRLGAARLILAVRTPSKGEDAKRDIEANPIHPDTSAADKAIATAEEVTSPQPVISVWQLD